MQCPVTSSATLLRWVKPSAGQHLSQSLRCFSSSGNAYMSSKRDMQTATAYRPHTLPSSFPTSFPMPLNAGGSDASVSAEIPLPAEPSQATSKPEASTISQQEGEAQTPKPAATPKAAAPKAAKPRRTLRARKAALKLTPLAIQHLRKLMDNPEPKFIRVGVRNRGCSGLSYHLEYVDKPGKFDESVEQDGVKVLIDSKALFSIIDSEMDWNEDALSRKFVFRNPNVSKFSPYYKSNMRQ